MATRFCTNYGTALPPNARFCGACGNAQSDSHPAPNRRGNDPRRVASRPAALGCLAVLATIVVILVIVSATSKKTSNVGGSAAPSGSPASAARSTPEPPGFGDGTWKVGPDIRPGTYRAASPSDNCYWERLKGFSGSLDDTLANDNTDAPAVVTIAASDAGFKTDGCGRWTNQLVRITTSTTSFGAGTYIVGLDISPGTYRNSGGESCYWARLKGFSGSLDDTLANDNVSTPTVVTIAPTDRGFSSNGCGTWTKQ